MKRNVLLPGILLIILSTLSAAQTYNFNTNVGWNNPNTGNIAGVAYVSGTIIATPSPTAAGKLLLSGTITLRRCTGTDADWNLVETRWSTMGYETALGTIAQARRVVQNSTQPALTHAGDTYTITLTANPINPSTSPGALRIKNLFNETYQFGGGGDRYIKSTDSIDYGIENCTAPTTTTSTTTSTTGTITASTGTTSSTTTTTTIYIPPVGDSINVTFTYFAYDPYGFQYCALYTNITGSWSTMEPFSGTDLIDYNVENASNNKFVFHNVHNGYYIWNVYCQSVNASIPAYWIEETNWKFRVCAGCEPCATRCFHEGYLYGRCVAETCEWYENPPANTWFCPEDANACCCGNTPPSTIATTTTTITTITLPIPTTTIASTSTSTSTTLATTTTTVTSSTSTTTTSTTTTSSSTTTTTTSTTTTLMPPLVWNTDVRWNNLDTGMLAGVAHVSGTLIATPSPTVAGRVQLSGTITLRKCNGTEADWNLVETSWSIVGYETAVGTTSQARRVNQPPALTHAGDTYTITMTANPINPSASPGALRIKNLFGESYQFGGVGDYYIKTTDSIVYPECS